MTKPREILRQPPDSPGAASERTSRHTLPPDLVAKAGRRLSLAALVYAGAYLLAYGSGRLSSDWGDFWDSARVLPLPDVFAGAFIGLSIALFFFARTSVLDGRRLLDFGLVYEVIGAWGIDIHLAWGMWPEGGVGGGISWVCVWIVFFPLIVPSTPGKTFVASLLAAASTPVLYFIGRASGGPALDTAYVVQVFMANAICVGIAVVGSRVVYRLGSDISRARRMGAYHLVHKLGEGGMGEVWMAEHRMLARPAAIKLLRTTGGDGGTGGTPGGHLHRFEREVQATAQLRSPHTVEVYDYGLTEDHRFYYVMELLDGLNLEELVKQHGPVPAERCVAILRQACHSLAEAHADGLVHRDIKPANIYLCRYGLELDFVKVLDFGLVKRSGGASDVRVTAVGTFAGTPAYGAPESAVGEDGAVDGRSDLYSLGCVAFWLLTGRTVFEARHPVQMLMQHVNRPPDTPSRHTELPVPPELDAVIMDLLQKEKDARPASASDLVARLDAIPLERRWDTERARQWWDRHHPPRPWPKRATPLEGAVHTSLVQPLDAGTRS
jgi:eukaryotic-like serine/threonine-protein kinase